MEAGEWEVSIPLPATTGELELTDIKTEQSSAQGSEATNGVDIVEGLVKPR